MAEIVLNVELREKNISRLRRDCGDRIPPLRRTRGLSDVKRIRPPQKLRRSEIRVFTSPSYFLVFQLYVLNRL